MPTPRPFNAPTTFAESPIGEINRQVQRLQQAASNPATRQGLSGFTQKILGYGANSFNAATPVLKNAVIGGGRLLAGRSDGSELPFLAAMATSDTIDAFNPQGAIDRRKRNEVRSAKYGQLPSDYRRTELLASGQIPGALPSDLKETEEAAGLSAERYRAGAGFPEQQFRDTLAPNGGDSKGTQTSPSPMKMEDVNTLLSGFGIRGFAPNQEFNSNQLPTTDNYPRMTEQFSIDDARTMGVSEEDAKLMAYGSGPETVFEDGKESSTQIFKDPGSRAFLDYDGPGGSMGAFRAAERARGMVRVGGQNYITNPLAGQDGQADFTAITDQQRRDVNAGRITAQDLSNDYMQRINAPVPGEFKPAMPEIGSYSNQNLANTGDRFSKLVEEEIEMPDFSRKLGLNFGTQPNTGMFAIDPEVFKYVSRDAYNSNVMKD